MNLRNLKARVPRRGFFFSRRNSKRRAVFGVIAAIILFSILFTAIFGYYYVTAQEQQSYQNAVKNAQGNLDQENEQNLVVYGSLTATQLLDININNTGSSVSVVAYWIYNGTSSAIVQYESSLTTSKLPMFIAQGQSVTYSNTNISITNLQQQYVIRVITAQGQVFEGGYPSQELVDSSVNSLISGGIGSLKMTFSSFSWYSYVSDPPPSYWPSPPGYCNLVPGRGYGCDNDGDYYLLCSNGQRCVMAIDGSAYNTNSCNAVTTCQLTLSTASPDDVIILAGYETSSSVHISSISDTAGLTWQVREQYSSNGMTEEWYAIASSVLSSDVVTVYYSGSATGGISAFAIHGANTAAPFDTHSGLPVTGTGSNTESESVSISTSNAYDMIIGIMSCTSSSTMSVGNGFTQASGPSNPNCTSSPRLDTEYQYVDSSQNGMSVSFSTSSKVTYNMIADAIVEGPAQINIAHPDPGTLVPQGQNSTGGCDICGSSVPLAFSVNITNYDPSEADLVINSHANLWVIETCDTSTFVNDCPQGNPVYNFYIMNVNPTTGVITSTSQGSFSQISIPYGATKTLYFGAAYDLSTTAFSSMYLTTDDSLYAGNNLAYYGEFAVFLLFEGTSIPPTSVSVYGQNIPFQTTVAADNLGWESQTPILCPSGSPTTFTLNANNSIFSGYSISEIVVNASALSSLSANAPAGWSSSISNGYITWTNTNTNDLITPGTSLTFTWSGTAPTVTDPLITFPTLITWNGGGFTNLQSSSACFV